MNINFRMKNISLLWIALIFCHSTLSSQDKVDTDYAYYEGDVYSYYINTIDDWLLDLGNAEKDGYTAAIYPNNESYFDYSIKIRIGIFKNGELTFDEFISADSIYLLKKTENLEIIRSDTVFYSSGNQAIIFETEDPGGEHELAMIAYIDMTTETVVYELLISSREYFGEGETRFREALERFEVVEKE